MTPRRLFLLISLPLFTLPYAVKAQSTCGPRDLVVMRLAEEFGESALALGLDNNNGMVEVFANVTSGSWTITVTSAGGRTCLISSGQSFEALPDAIQIEGKDI